MCVSIESVLKNIVFVRHVILGRLQLIPLYINNAK